MKKFFGILLIIIGALWSLMFLISIGAIEVGYTIFFLLIGAGVIFLGARLTKNKSPKKQMENSSQSYQQPQQQYSPPQPQSPQQQAPQHLTLQQIRELTAQKVNSIQSTNGYRVPAEQLLQTLYSLNDAQLPFSFGQSNKNGADMIAHWKLSDAEYLGMLGLNKHKRQDNFDVLLKCDEANGELRCKDMVSSKQSSFGIGGMGMEMSTFSGKSTSRQKEIVIGRKKDGGIGKVVDIDLDTRILHQAIEEVAQKCGWQIKRVAGRL